MLAKECCTHTSPILQSLFARLDYHKQHYGGEFINDLLRGTLKEILYYFCAQEAESAKLVSYNRTITELVNYIDEHIEEPLSINEICRIFHYSKSYLYKIFLSEMKVPIMRYIRTKKIFYADSLIKRGMKPTEAFEKCGFMEYTSFFRAYKNFVGHAPSSNERG